MTGQQEQVANKKSSGQLLLRVDTQSSCIELQVQDRWGSRAEILTYGAFLMM